MVRRALARRAGAVAIVGAAAIAAPGYGSSASVPGHASGFAAASPATFSIRIDARGRGTFTARGGVVDEGRAVVRRTVATGRLNATATLNGSKGRIVLSWRQRCGGRSGTWRVVSGTLAYANLTGRGTTAGRARCARPLGPAAFVHRGAVELPPPALAKPGSYGGRTAQDHALLFDVTPDGRSVANLLVGGFRYECVRSDGLRSPVSAQIDARYPGPFAIAPDGTFSIRAGAATIAGRFAGAGAAGTIATSFSLPADAQGRTSTCSGSTTWSVTSPPAPQRRPLAGTYCGFTNAGGGVCVDVTSDGSEVRNLRAEVVMTCGVVARIPVRITVASAGPMPIRTDLSFRGTVTQSFEGRNVGGAVSGTFDERGGLTGSVGLAQVTIVRDGVTHSCRTNGGFTARLQR
jgi:hypothetical protein